MSEGKPGILAIYQLGVLKSFFPFLHMYIQITVCFVFYLITAMSFHFILFFGIFSFIIYYFGRAVLLGKSSVVASSFIYSSHGVI